MNGTCAGKARLNERGSSWCSDWHEGELYGDDAFGEPPDAADWRAAAYERAATRPCVGPRVSAYDRATVCWVPIFFGISPLVGTHRCQPSAPVAR